MFRIGDFAKIARVSVKTLHHYDEIDLLKPEVVHAHTGYRFYTIDQLPKLNRILALKDLGVTLNQVRSMLNSEPSPVEIRGMLRLKEAELEDLIQAEQERLVRVKVRLKQMEREGMQHDYDILVKPIETRAIVSTRGTIPLDGNPFQQCQEMATDVYTWLRNAGGIIGASGAASIMKQ
jgi:DNA-binding transcriptional MerR regulator